MPEQTSIDFTDRKAQILTDDERRVWWAISDHAGKEEAILGNRAVEDQRIMGMKGGELIMKPTIGRTVHFNLEGGGVAPGIIIAVHGDTCVSLNVFTFAGLIVRTSVVMGTTTGNWFWPPRYVDTTPFVEEPTI
jgi:hypothetical protein